MRVRTARTKVHGALDPLRNTYEHASTAHARRSSPGGFGGSASADRRIRPPTAALTTARSVVSWTDPDTGSRYREDLAFEVVSEQTQAAVTRKAPTMLARGVQRVFAVFVKQGRVAEWVQEEGKTKGRWVDLAADAKISHPSLAEPLPVAAILDATSVDDTVARALAAKGNSVIREISCSAKRRLSRRKWQTSADPVPAGRGYPAHCGTP